MVFSKSSTYSAAHRLFTPTPTKWLPLLVPARPPYDSLYMPVPTIGKLSTLYQLLQVFKCPVLKLDIRHDSFKLCSRLAAILVPGVTYTLLIGSPGLSLQPSDAHWLPSRRPI